MGERGHRTGPAGFSHALKELPKNDTAPLLPSKGEYNEQRPQETSDGVAHSWADPLRSETQPKPGGSSQAEDLAHDKVHLRWRRTGNVLVLYPQHTPFTPAQIQQEPNK